jgi:aspartate/tyrosine/aromatic aminotransferase
MMPDPILSLMETFKQDPRDHKVNLSIGLYYNEAGIIPRLDGSNAPRLQHRVLFTKQQRRNGVTIWTQPFHYGNLQTGPA